MDNTQIELQQETQAMSISEQAAAVKVIDKASYDKASGLANAIKDLTKQVTDYWKPIKAKAKAVHSDLCSKEKQLLKPLQDAQSLIGNQQRKFLHEQELIRQAAERKVQEKAEAIARKEREKLAAQAAKAAEKGNEEKAEELAAQAAEVVAAPVFVAPVVDKNVRKDIAVQVTDLKALCAAIGSGQVPTTVIKGLPGPLKTWAKAMQIKNGQVPGIVITETITPINRG